MIGSDGPGCGAPLPGAVIVLVAVPVTPSLVAVILAVPALTPVARPVAETVATAPLLVFQVTVRPVRACPAASRGVALRDRKSTRLNSSHGYISYAVFCLKKKIDTARRSRYACVASNADGCGIAGVIRSVVCAYGPTGSLCSGCFVAIRRGTIVSFPTSR